ncbi:MULTISPECIES: LPS export ABC transporter permease LptF [Phyllobacteriaceae]|jgi:lipopolysaccharide export system permease protein|uniref:LPS export ABC transporter permease LptF n=2 Tax=Pseudomonadota TaxID=1224 RepID=A0A1C2EB43_9HYPH|nr:MULTISPECIES: LPS export ABC transporter permease LptF [Mesorhizobium]MBN9235205.1 LPS export ABC transporter permease LptF [Mesorhizobium sp.]MDQ0332874.1 lipopolysaccharide export system permease protein [Mesorhizobium sp. YL-MeA3-2017]OCX24181.1 LPS export ABC transporter permease LptF [Mesorhizobium hungaricum]
MKVAELYIFRRALSLFLAALAWTLAIVWTTQVLTRINLVTDNGQSAATFFQVAALILPTIIPIVVPFALIVAVAQTLSVMNSDSELVVISAAGSSRMTVIKPILILALAAGVFSFIVDNGVEPYARQKNRELIASARADFLSLIIQEGTFRKIEDGLFVQIGERFADGGLGSIFVADSRQPGTDLVYYAKTGAVIDKGKEKVLLMNDGVVHRKAPAGDVSVIRFTSYAFDLSAFATAAQTTLYPKDQTTQYLLNPNPNDKIYQQSPDTYRAELALRFSEWAYTLAFAMIALAVAGDARSHREARIHPLITAVCIALFVRWLGFFAAGKASTNPFYNYVVLAVPFAASVVAGWVIYSNHRMELPVSWADWLTNMFSRMGDFGPRLRLWWANRVASRQGRA